MDSSDRQTNLISQTAKLPGDVVSLPGEDRLTGVTRTILEQSMELVTDRNYPGHLRFGYPENDSLFL